MFTFKKLCLIAALALAFAAPAQADPIECSSGTFASGRFFCEPLGSGAPGPIPNPPPPVPVPTDRFAGCPANAVKVDGKWGNSAFVVDFSTQVVSIRIDVPATWASSGQSISWGEYGSAPTTRTAAISTKACSFEYADMILDGWKRRSFVVANGPSFTVKAGAASGSTYGLAPGGVYYLNIKNADAFGLPTCANESGASCAMRGNLPR